MQDSSIRKRKTVKAAYFLIADKDVSTHRLIPLFRLA